MEILLFPYLVFVKPHLNKDYLETGFENCVQGGSSWISSLGTAHHGFISLASRVSFLPNLPLSVVKEEKIPLDGYRTVTTPHCFLGISLPWRKGSKRDCTCAGKQSALGFTECVTWKPQGEVLLLFFFTASLTNPAQALRDHMKGSAEPVLPPEWQMLFLRMRAFSHKQTALSSEEPALLCMSGKQKPFKGQYFKMNRRKTGLLVWRVSLLSSCNTCLKTTRTRQWINNHSLDQTALRQVKYCSLLLTWNVSADGGLCSLCCGHTECSCFAKNTTVLTDWEQKRNFCGIYQLMGRSASTQRRLQEPARSCTATTSVSSWIRLQLLLKFPTQTRAPILLPALPPYCLLHEAIGIYGWKGREDRPRGHAFLQPDELVVCWEVRRFVDICNWNGDSCCWLEGHLDSAGQGGLVGYHHCQHECSVHLIVDCLKQTSKQE